VKGKAPDRRRERCRNTLDRRMVSRPGRNFALKGITRWGEKVSGGDPGGRSALHKKLLVCRHRFQRGTGEKGDYSQKEKERKAMREEAVPGTRSQASGGVHLPFQKTRSKFRELGVKEHIGRKEGQLLAKRPKTQRRPRRTAQCPKANGRKGGVEVKLGGKNQSGVKTEGGRPTKEQ